MTIRELTQILRQTLRPLYDEREAAAVAYVYVCAKFGMQRYEIALRGDEPVDDLLMADIQRDMEKLAQGCPVQYVLGETEFYGLPFEVSPAVLIPRQETEELVQMVVESFKERELSASKSLWDIGTGSGCIAVSLAKGLPGVEVFATDISEEALAVARRNAQRNGVEVAFARHDMADVEHIPFGERRFDAIVSNPPYIPASDRAAMHRNVTDYEPSLALFVPDDDALLCYESVARLAQRVLVPGGRLFVETYHDFHEGIAAAFSRYGLRDVQSVRDLNGQLRFVTAVNRGDRKPR
ncbi:MAG: peptide chain release factor N(5)-glutamine methyltransferase [Bacteroidales bacterium]|nr:peptide chain release factor N(5)-glutamine methyltransferase [Bacteroidales bacterium]